MSQEYTLIRDIVSGHNERMHNLKKYYPFFKLSQVSFSQYMDGRYEILDMGYILMAVLRFFIEENNFHEKLVTYEEYADFMHELYIRDFDITPDKNEEKELTGYIFDKLKNDGKPFSYTYFDPDTKKKKTMRTRLIDSKIIDETVMYFITSDGITFYLDTKEMKEESNITIAQVLLSKMIATKNFKGGAEVAMRINNEVSKLIGDKNEILNVISYDVFAGIRLYEEFMSGTVKWFEDEQRLFKKNKELIDKALKSCENDIGYYEAMEDIYHLENELNKAMNKHSELLEACIALQSQTDELIAASKLNRIRMAFDFKKTLSELMRRDDITRLESFIIPLFKPAVRKTFSLPLIDNMLTCKNDNGEIAEKTEDTEYEENFKYPDELEEDRIHSNYSLLIEALFALAEREKSFDLIRYNEVLREQFGDKALFSADYYSFIVHLCQKNVYDMTVTLQKPDTFLEEMICECARQNEEFTKKYGKLQLHLTFTQDKLMTGNHETQNIIFGNEDL